MKDLKLLSNAFTKTILIIFLGITIVQSSPTNQFCPNYCQCDLYNDLNRADCSAKRLIYANLDIPAAVEILNLNYNDITQLDDSCFASYQYLYNLTVAHNAIHTIYLDAFTKLQRIHAIDLSYNRLEHIDERLFEMNTKLFDLNLEGNKFNSLTNKPFLRSRSLKQLNLRNSQIGYITTEMFSALPQLEHLDISQNLMISLNPLGFNALKQLKTINLDENPWNCDKALMKTIETLGRRNIDVSLIDCSTHKKWLWSTDVDRFERIEMLDEHSQEAEIATITNASAERTSEATVVGVIPLWRIPPNSNEPVNENGPSDQMNDMDDDSNWQHTNDDNSDDATNTKLFLGYPSISEICNSTQTRLCRRYSAYLMNVLKRLSSDANKHNIIWTQNDMIFTFALGVTIGISIVVCIWSCTMVCKFKRKKRNALERLLNGEGSMSNSSNLPTVPPPIMRTRRGRHLRRPATSAPPATTTTTRMIAHYDDGQTNFFTGLFGRPARHRYYRTINQNTATLIRRLSRSNLFNNRLSQHFERQRSRDQHGEATAATDEHEEGATDAMLNSRPETPPPSYVEVIVTDNKGQ